MPRSAPIDGFSLAYDRHGAGPPAVLLHGWPGHRGDYRDVVPRPAERFDEIVALYARPAAFTAGIAWYRSGSSGVQTALTERPPEEPLAIPTSVLWPELDPLYPPAWSDRLGEFYADFDLRLLPGTGHFAPLEAPAEVAEATVRALRR